MKVTMKDIAERLGVSINAVSLALNNRPGVGEELRRKILRIAEETGYLQKKSKYERTFMRTNLCVMMQSIYASSRNFCGFYGQVLYAVSQEAGRYGYDIIIDFFDEADMQPPGCVAERRVSGIIVIGKIGDKNISRLQEYGLPLVVVDHASLRRPLNCIVTDNKLGGFIQTQYLLDRNFTRIGFFGDLRYSLSIKERYFGFQEALHQSGLDVGGEDAAHWYSITAPGLERAVLNDDTSVGLKLLQGMEALPEAFVCSNDQAAFYLIRILRDMGIRVPEDVSVVGFDDIDLAGKIVPALTTVRVDREDMGVRAVQRIRYLLSHPQSGPESVIMPVALIERESAARSSGTAQNSKNG